MRLVKTVPKTDVDKLAKEVLSHGPSAAMPKNLPDRWLRALGRDLARFEKAQMEGRPDDSDLSGAILVISHLRAHQKKIAGLDTSLSEQEIEDSLEKFNAAIRAEILGRETGVFLGAHDINSVV